MNCLNNESNVKTAGLSTGGTNVILSDIVLLECLQMESHSWGDEAQSKPAITSARETYMAIHLIMLGTLPPNTCRFH